ncbi:transcription factor CP2-like protein 1 [Chelonus insularis]|uniref:transcription factor CP2-like protein 1 n=1 Tax=Chelonus insularis TaxID=460826 RepID=UPI00158E0F39|nr:transcription factor CP2-like protein 1 [Chelonus insularis]
METSGVLAYKFPDDDTSDDSSSSSSSSSNSSSSSIVSKNMKPSMNDVNTQISLSSKDYTASIIDRLREKIILMRTNSPDDEFLNKSFNSKESEEEIQETEESISTECNNVNCTEDDNVGSDDGSTLLQFFHLGPSSTQEDITAWLRYNNFGDLIDIFNGFNYYDLRRLNRNDFIEMCGTVKGIQIFNAVQMKPVRPLRTVYCALEPIDNNKMIWQPVYLHCLSAIDFNAEIVARFKLSTRKHSLWIEGPYGIHILVNNEFVEYMEDNDMFLIRLVEYPAVEHYKIILKKYL